MWVRKIYLSFLLQHLLWWVQESSSRQNTKSLPLFRIVTCCSERSESNERFMEDQASSPLYDLDPPSPLPSLPSVSSTGNTQEDCNRETTDKLLTGKGGGEANPTTARKPCPLLTSHYTLPAWICNSIHFQWSPTGSAAVQENTAEALFTLVHKCTVSPMTQYRYPRIRKWELVGTNGLAASRAVEC